MRQALVLLSALLLGATSAPAQEAAPAVAGKIGLELNSARPSAKGCRLGFVVENGIGTALDRLAYEIVLFDKQNLVKRLLVLDFGALPAEKKKVREFDLAEIDCNDLSAVLINDVSACEGQGVAGRCLTDLALSTRSDVRFEL